MAEAENATLSSNFLPLTEEELVKAVEELRKSSTLGYFFPILKQERKRVTLMCVMFCTISFTYAFLRLFKDRVVYSVLDNTETKNWLKLLTFVVTQLLVIFSQNISAKTDFNNAFKVLTKYFALFLGVNTAFIIGSNYVQPSDTFTDCLFIDDILTVRGLKVFYPLAIVLNQYTYSVFYVLAEVIGSMMVSFCFMTYVNNNTTESQNKRFVRVLLFFSNISSCLAGVFYNIWVNYYKSRPKKDSDIYYFIWPVAAILLYFFVLTVKSLLEKEFENKIVVSTGASKKTGSKKRKIGFKDSITLMVSSKFLYSMCGLAFFYNVSANLLETVNSSAMSATANFFDKEKSFYATGFKSFDLIFTSIASSLIIISPISLLPDRIGISYFAMVPLVISLVSASVLLAFGVVNLPLTGQENIGFLREFNFTEKYPFAEAVAGTMAQSCIKISKYAFYDIVKELIAMKIDPSVRPLFKGVFDGSITKFGKSIGSLYGIFMLYVFGSFDARYYFPITYLVMLLFCGIWFKCIRYLTGSYKKAKETGEFIDPAFKDGQKITDLY